MMVQARRNEKNSGGLGVYKKNVDELGQLSRRMVQLKSLKVPRNT